MYVDALATVVPPTDEVRTWCLTGAYKTPQGSRKTPQGASPRSQLARFRPRPWLPRVCVRQRRSSGPGSAPSPPPSPPLCLGPGTSAWPSSFIRAHPTQPKYSKVPWSSSRNPPTLSSAFGAAPAPRSPAFTAAIADRARLDGDAVLGRHVCANQVVNTLDVLGLLR